MYLREIKQKISHWWCLSNKFKTGWNIVTDTQQSHNGSIVKSRLHLVIHISFIVHPFGVHLASFPWKKLYTHKINTYICGMGKFDPTTSLFFKRKLLNFHSIHKHYITQFNYRMTRYSPGNYILDLLMILDTREATL